MTIQNSGQNPVITSLRADSFVFHRGKRPEIGTTREPVVTKYMQFRPPVLVILFAAITGCSAPSATPPKAVTTAQDSASDTGKSVGDGSDSTAIRDTLGRTRSDTDAVVHTGMRNVNMHISPGIVLSIKRLRGTVLPTRKGAVPALNSKASMLINIESADISIDTTSLANMLNQHVFGYPKSPLRNLHVSIDGNEMVQTGKMKKVVWLSFRIRATMSLTPEHEIRVHPVAISVAGIGVKGLSKKLGGLSKMLTLEPGHGARIDGDDFILSPTEMLPPPAIRGKLSSITLEPGGVRQTFGSANSEHTEPERRNGSVANNYMYFRGGTLRFGKLTMSGTDLEIVDADPSNAFDYSLDRYQEHLVAGHSNTTPEDGLIVVMPDLQKLGQGSPGTTKKP
ncbi:MAG: hypothetical protein ABJB74_10095 [Gemmatimonas sp.]